MTQNSEMVVSFFVRKFNQFIKVIDKSHYQSEQYLTYLTMPEWFHVETATRLAEFLGAKHSFFRFPYFKQARQNLNIVFQTYRLIRKHKTWSKTLFSQYNPLVLLTALTSMGELFVHGLISTALNLILPKENDTQMQAHLASYYAYYAKDIENKPFFMHDFQAARLDLSAKYKACTDRSWTDWFSWKLIAIELFVKQILFGLLKHLLMIASETPPAYIIVKYHAQGIHNPMQGIAEFKQKLEEARLDQLQLIEEQIYAKEKNEPTVYTVVYAKLRPSPNLDFRHAIQALTLQDIHIRKVAGLDYIPVKSEIGISDNETLALVQEVVAQVSHTYQNYVYIDALHKDICICVLDVAALHLNQALDQLEQLTKADFNFVHHF